MKPGFFTMPLHPPGANMTETLKSDLDQIVKLDELGYAEAWIGEHFTAAWENIPSPELFIAQALGVTKNIRLGTGVTCMPNHDPFMIAHRIAQLDHMARGRFHWGVGSGLNDTELGLRLRYEVRREIAPYVGVNWTQRYGAAADFARDEGGGPL